MALRKQPQLVKPLPGEIRSKIRSGIAITRISDCVEELVYNSVDAGAKTITVRVNLDNFNVTVDDDGSGLTETDLESVGVRGEALASIIEVSSTVDIRTRPKETLGVELLKKYENGRVAGFIEKHNTVIRMSGTTITVGKLLSKLPVRQKRVDKSIQLEEVKNSLEKIYLINPCLNLELRNDKTGLRILKVTASASYAEAFNQLFESAIGQEVNFLEEHFLFKKLFFSLTMSSVQYKKKYYQFVFLNGRFLRRCRIHKWVRDSVYDRASNSNSPKYDKYPVYILNITCPLGEYDVSLEPKKQVIEFTDWESVQSGVEGLISKLKSKHNIGIVESSNAKRIDKNQSGVTSYDVKGALHSRFVTRIHGQDQEATKSYNSDRGSVGKSSSTSTADEKREPRVQRRSLTRTGSNSHIVDVRAIRKRMKADQTDIPNHNTSLQMQQQPAVKKPRLTAGVFEKFPVWKAEFQKEKSPLPMLRSKSSPNLKKSQLANPNPANVNVIEAMNSEKQNHQHHLPYDPWKMQRFFQDCDNPLQNEYHSKRKDEVIEVQTQTPTSNSSANKDLKTPASAESSLSMSVTEMEQMIRSKSRHYLESVFKEDWNKVEEKNDLVRVILHFYSRTVGRESRDKKSHSSLFKPKQSPVVKPEKTLPLFKKPRPKANSTRRISEVDLTELDVSMQSDAQMHKVFPTKATGIKVQKQSQDEQIGAISKCVPPLLNVYPIQKSHTAEWNDKMMLGNDSESDVDFFPTDWSVEIVSDTNNQEWLKTVDSSGKILYVNLNSGESSYDMVKVFGSSRQVRVEEVRRTNPKKYHWLRKYFPRGFQQFCNPKPREVVKDGDPSKLSNSIIGNSVLKYINKTSDTDDFSKWKDADESKYFSSVSANSTNGQTFTSLTSSELRCWKKLDGATNSFRFSKDDLENVSVICPFDRKFILATIKLRQPANQQVLIVAFDQHAVHERIRLETFLEESFVNPKASIKYLKSMEIMPPYKFNMSETEVRLMQTFEDFFNQSGLKFQQISSTCIKIQGVPKCFGERAATEPLASREQLFRSLIFNLIQEQIHHIRDTKKGSFTTVPKAVFEVLCSQACHGAIKFGDELDVDTCKKLISDLKKCKTPFQCAHGRPSVVPLTYTSNVTNTHNSVHNSSASDAGCSKCSTHEECSSYFCKTTLDMSSGYFSFRDTTTSSNFKKPQHPDPYDVFDFSIQTKVTKPSDFDALFGPANKTVNKNDEDDEDSPYFF